MNGVNRGLNGQAANRADGALGKAQEVDIDRTYVVTGIQYLYTTEIISN